MCIRQINYLFKKEITDSFGLCCVFEVLPYIYHKYITEEMTERKSGPPGPQLSYQVTQSYHYLFLTVSCGSKEVLTIFCIYNILDEPFPSYFVSSHMVF